ncbi:MAG: SUMF1/EgtB/PvdO family nonheme iron enzyme [Planctomycetes bacterium]|nr:SUMF1/EgtB/PvdO family nonheme iron enzyme [Planctomycetota bacterium]
MSAARLVLAAVLLAGCAVGGSGGGGAGTGSAPAAGGGVSASADAVRGEWQLLDLVSGAQQPLASLPDLAANPAYRGALVAFRRLQPGGALGSPAGAFARQDDEPPQAVAADRAYYLGACELTRAQWRVLAGSEPWRGLPGEQAGGDDLPALGVSLVAVQAALTRWNAGHSARLALPQPWQWELAARAGSTASFPWGEDRRAAVAALHAVTAESGGAPRPVGGRQANAFGLHDLCGNAWELTADGTIHGGSWADALALARPANRAAILPDSVHATVGVRLVLIP